MANPVNFKTFPGSMVLVVLCTAAMVSGCKGKSKTVALPDTPAPASVSQLPGKPSLSVSSSEKNLHFSWSAPSGAVYFRVYENADGISGFTRISGDLTAPQFDREIAVHLFDWLNARYTVEACNPAGCIMSNEISAVSAMVTSIDYLKASNAGGSDAFGFSFALSSDGNTLAVGALQEASAATGVNGDQNDNSATNAGAVYVFVRSAGSWVQQAYIKASNTDADDVFGNALALSNDGNTLAIGAVREDNAAGSSGNDNNNSGPNSGAVYVFTRNLNQWTQQAYIKPSVSDAYDYFGYRVALSADGNTLAASAIEEDSNATVINGSQTDNSATNSGAVYVFLRNADVWSQQAYVKASNAQAGDYFGGAIALASDGNTLAVGAAHENSNATGINGDQSSNSLNHSGAVYVYTRSVSTWSQQAYVKASNSGAGDWFGSSVSLAADGNILAVAARYEGSVATGINGNQSDNSAVGSGAAYVFTRSGSTWSQQTYVKSSNTDSSDNFGMSLQLSGDGNTLAIGAFFEDSGSTGIEGNQFDNSAVDSGAVYLFTYGGSGWSQKSYIKASNAETVDYFGGAVALSADGKVLVVGAEGEDSNAAGINGNQADNSVAYSGAVYVY
jgi:FG-GAP repeat